MKFDAVVSLKVVNNQRLMLATHRGEYRDLTGALAVTSDASHTRWNCIEGFTTDNLRLESVLDVGFALLRAFDRTSAARLTPLDRPANIAESLAQRGLAVADRDTSMIFDGDASAIREGDGVQVRRCDPEDAGTFAAVQVQAFGMPNYLKPMLVGAALANVLDDGHALYLAYRDGVAVATALVVRDGDTAGIYSVSTLKAHRRTGIASTLIRRAITDAQAAGASCICLETDSTSDARALYERMGFRPVHEAVLWVAREA